MEELEYAFLKLDPPVEGTATTEGHAGEIVLRGLHQKVIQKAKWAEDDSDTARVVDFDNIGFEKYYDKASPILLQSCAMKTKYDQAVITIKSGDVETLTLTLKKVLITKGEYNYSAGLENPLGCYECSFKSIQWKKGTNVGAYDLDANKAP